MSRTCASVGLKDPTSPEECHRLPPPTLIKNQMHLLPTKTSFFFISTSWIPLHMYTVVSMEIYDPYAVNYAHVRNI